jgi:hypothetical protein
MHAPRRLGLRGVLGENRYDLASLLDCRRPFNRIDH